MEQQYPIFIGNTAECMNELNRLVPKRISKGFVIADKNTNTHCLPLLETFFESKFNLDVLEVEPGELSKKLAVVEQIWRTLKSQQADRYAIIINLGGGVISDLGGFVASTFMRGIRFINMPTSLLAMVDASIGGKNGIDFDGAKNIIGSINNPDAVIINTDFLKTLPSREWLCGWAEMLKHALIQDALHFEELAEIEDPTQADIFPLIRKSVAIKYNIVSTDLKENGARKKLNFGHTIGHAIESYYLQSGDQFILHGEAVAAGIIMAAYISMKNTGLSEKEYDKIMRTIDWIYPRLPIKKTDILAILEFLQFDKKAYSGNNRMVLLKSIGHAEIDINITNQQIEEALHDYIRYA